MIKLREWYFQSGIINETGEKGFRAWGFVSGHPKLQDGSHIHTSVIDNMELDAENNRLLMYTHSKNTYELRLADMKFEDFENTKDCLQFFNVPAPALSECENLHKKDEEELIAKMDGILQNNELYLQLNGVFTQSAFYKNKSGKVRRINAGVHVGMHQDSYLITDFQKREVDFRYWNGYMNIQPYHWSDGLEALLIEVTSSKDIEFKGSERTIVCKAGEVTRIESKEYCGEGLLSPDVVNGKSALRRKE